MTAIISWTWTARQRTATAATRSTEDAAGLKMGAGEEVSLMYNGWSAPPQLWWHTEHLHFSFLFLHPQKREIYVNVVVLCLFNGDCLLPCLWLIIWRYIIYIASSNIYISFCMKNNLVFTRFMHERHINGSGNNTRACQYLQKQCMSVGLMPNASWRSH